MADQNKKKYIKYEDTTYELVDGEARDRLAALEASASFRITSHPADAAAVGSGYAAFRVAALGTGLTFQWQYKTPSGSWKNCTSSTEGYNADTLVVQGVNGSINRNGYQYRCVVSNGAGASAASNPATLTVLAAVAQSGSYNDLTDKPSDPGGGGGGGAVSSVNGKTGVVVLDAEDVGALPDDTVIPPAVTEQTVSGWGFTKNTGTYSKPSGGIPTSDLASAVQTSLGKADTALQQHQSLADYQTKAITDTGGYFTTDTVEGALQEIGAELAGINTLIGSGVIT